MIAQSRGFTVLEILMVIMLLGVVARMVVGVVPENKAQDPLQLWQESARWAWQQAQLEGRIWQMRLTPQNWQLFTLTGEPDGRPGPLPETFWHPVTGGLAQGSLPQGKFHPATGTSLPATLWFLPDGDISQPALIWRAESGAEQRLTLDASEMSATSP
ncbi:prepilin-type N-terminal cleavage/methylation domain-containing protein [Enterobacter mori]